jgi:hypothetical protein
LPNHFVLIGSSEMPQEPFGFRRKEGSERFSSRTGGNFSRAAHYPPLPLLGFAWFTTSKPQLLALFDRALSLSSGTAGVFIVSADRSSVRSGCVEGFFSLSNPMLISASPAEFL